MTQMRPRHAPEVVPADIEGGAGRPVSLAAVGGRPFIQPFQGVGGVAGTPGSKAKRTGGNDQENTKFLCTVIGGIWFVGWVFGYELLWPINLVLNILFSVFNYPLFSRGAPLISAHAQVPGVEVNQLSQKEVATYLENYINSHGDAALIFASHDGYPQIVNGLLHTADLGYRDLIDARDDSGNTALIYAVAKGFQQTTALLLRNGADPDVANVGNGGRTPLMEAAGVGSRDIVNALRLTPNISIDLQDDYGNTALHYAAYHGNLGVAIELLKSNPNKALQNNYGHTALSYAETQKQKAVADALKRSGSTRSQRLLGEDKQKDLSASYQKPSHVLDELTKVKMPKEDKHVKGSAELLHKDEEESFAPKLEKDRSMTSAERQALEDQLHRLRRKHEEVELKSQKRIVELLEKSSEQQRLIDTLQAEYRAARLNHTDLKFKLQELESRHRSAELRVAEEDSRTRSLEDRHRRAKADSEEHQHRAEAAERERDLYQEASKRHEDSLKRVQDEIKQNEARSEQRQREISELRVSLERTDKERSIDQERIAGLQLEIKKLLGEDSGGAVAAVASAEHA